MNAKVLALLLASSSLLAVAPCPVSADDKPPMTLPEVLSRHLQALGGPHAIVNPTSERIIGTIERGGLRGTETTVYKGEKYWTEEKIGIFDFFAGYDGKVAWQRDSNGNTRPFSAAGLRDLHSDQYFNADTYLLPNRPSGEVTLRPQTEKRTGNYILDVNPPGGVPYSLYLDPKTFLTVKKQHYADDELITTTYSGFKAINGTMTATVTHEFNGDRKSDQTYTLTDDQENIDAPDSLFAMPSMARDYRWVHPEATSATIPFDASDHSINLFVGINGQPAYLILDSGASGFAIDKRATDYLKIGHQGTFRARGYGGATNTYPVKLDTFEIADGIIFSDMTATAIELPENFGFGEATPSVGFIGYEILSRFVVQVDYQAEHITLYDPDTWKPVPSDGQALPLDIDSNVPNVTAQLDDFPPAKFLIDTGDAGACIRLYRPFVLQNHLSGIYPSGMDMEGYGVGGAAKVRQVRARSFTLAGQTLKNVPVSMALDDKAGSSRRLAGALGHDFLSHFVVTFDYPHQRVFFGPNKTTQQPFDTRTFGIAALSMPDDLVKDKECIKVMYVDPKSPASKAGLVRGDIITQIDDQSATALGLGGVRRLLSPDGGKDTHELSIIGNTGGTGKIKVTLYDSMPQGVR